MPVLFICNELIKNKNTELVRDLKSVIVTCKAEEDLINKNLCSLPPTSLMLHIKFDQNWPTGFRDSQVQKCEIFVTQEQITPKRVV